MSEQEDKTGFYKKFYPSIKKDGQLIADDMWEGHGHFKIVDDDVMPLDPGSQNYKEAGLQKIENPPDSDWFTWTVQTADGSKVKLFESDSFWQKPNDSFPTENIPFHPVPDGVDCPEDQFIAYTTIFYEEPLHNKLETEKYIELMLQFNE